VRRYARRAASDRHVSTVGGLFVFMDPWSSALGLV